MAVVQKAQRRTRPGHFTLRTPIVELRLNGRVLVMTSIACVLVFLLASWAMTLGSFRIGLLEVIRAMLGEGAHEHEFIVQTLRMPRVLSALLLGAAFAVSGAIFQALVRNPLVSPDIIGIDSGATLIAVFWIVTGADQSMLPLAAFAGSMLAAAAIYVLTWKGGISPNRLVLVGIGIGAICSSLTTYLLVKYPIERVQAAQLWSVGSVYGTRGATSRS